MQLPYRFGRYTLVEKIAVGGTAEVYRAIQQAEGGFAKTVAVKRLLPAWGGNDEVAAMLVDEARALMHLQHGAIVQALELGCAEGSPFLAMEFVDGIDAARLLADLVRDRAPLPPALALHIANQVLLALEVAHRTVGADGRLLGIVHRDISPANILLSWNGEVKVTDFGIAKGLHRTHLTELGQLKGKYAYMAPEQARGESIDLRADLFACGIVLWELLVGRRRFEGASDVEVLEQVQRAQLPGAEIASFSPELRTVLLLALAPDPADRYRSAAEMLRDVRCAMRVEGDAVAGLELASFLRGRYPLEQGRRCAPIEVPPTALTPATRVMGPAPSVSAKRPVHRLARAATLAILLAVVAGIPPSKAGVAVAGPETAASLRRAEEATPSPQVPSPPVAASSDEAPGPPPRVRGAVAIDSDPPGVRGTLVLGGERRPIETPFALEDIELGDGVAGRVELSAPGFRQAEAAFRLDASRPAFVTRIVLAHDAPAALSVHARPWGLVDIAGVANGRETPLTDVKLRAGAYAVSVRHPPSGRVATARVLLEGGEAKRCLATFGDAATMRCR